MDLLGFSLGYLILQAGYSDPTSSYTLFILVLLVLLGVILWVRIKDKTEKDEKKRKNRKRIVRCALIGWLLFATPVVACDTISWGNNLIYSILEPMVWLLAIPGALFGAIIGVLMNNKENKVEVISTKTEETLESKIKGLKNLLDQGLLTQAEFDEQKKKILNN